MSPYKVTNFFIVMRIFKIHSFSNIQICNTVLLTIVTMLYIASPRLVYFITGYCYLWFPFPFCPHPTLWLWQSPICCLYQWALDFFVLFLFLDSTYKWDHMILVLLWIMPSVSTHVVTNCNISFFLLLNSIPLYVCMYMYMCAFVCACMCMCV